MKRTFGILIAVAFAFVAYTTYAETQTTPTPTKTPTPAVRPMETQVPTASPTTSPVKDIKAEANDICKKKGLVGVALDECVKNELARLEKPKAPEAVTTPATAVKTPATTSTPTTQEASKKTGK